MRYKIIILLFFVNLMLTPSIFFAHPLDITNSEIYISDTQTLNIETVIHIFECFYLLEKLNNIEVSPYEWKFEKYKSYFLEYFNEHYLFFINDKEYQINDITIPFQSKLNIYSIGLKVNFKINSEEKISKLKIVNTLFNDDFPLQTNRIKIINYEGVEYKKTRMNENVISYNPNSTPKLFYKILDKKVYELEVKINYRDKIPIKVSDISKDTSIENRKLQNKSSIFTGFLSYVTNTIASGLNEGDVLKILITMFFVFILGVLHSLEGGHGKIILISHLIDNNKGFLSGMLFSLFLSITHILDILIVGLIFYFLSSFFNFSDYIIQIQVISISILFGISLFMLTRAIIYIRKKKNVSGGEEKLLRLKMEKNKSKGKLGTIGLAILSGLAPCPFGWAILMTIMSINKIQWVFPIILLFGMGIFFFLLVLSFVIVFFKRLSVNRLNNSVLRYMPLVSSLFLIIFSSYLLINLLYKL